MDQHILSGMGAAIPPGGVRNLAAKKPHEARFVMEGGIYEFNFVGGYSLIMQVEGLIPTAIHHDPEKNMMFVVPVIASGTMMRFKDGKWVEDPPPNFAYVVFPHVVSFLVLHDPTEKKEEVPDVTT